MQHTRLASIAGGVALAALVSACSTSPRVDVTVPAATTVPYATTTTTVQPVVTSPVGMEYGRVVNIEYFAGGMSSRPNVPGAIVGAVAGALVGNQIGSGTGRAAATVLGGAAGAAVGSQVGNNVTATSPVYRVTVQTDTGIIRYYDVPASGDLRVGDRVRVDSGVIYRA